MRIILVLFVLFIACKGGQGTDSISFKDLEPMQGTWFGSQVGFYDNDSTGFSYPCKLEVKNLKDSLELNMINTYADGHEETEKGVISIHKNGTVLRLGPSEFVIKEVIKTKDELAINAYKEEGDNDKPATIRLQFLIRENGMDISRDVKYKGAADYFNRVHLKVSKN
jgi:hypothetical protein